MRILSFYLSNFHPFPDQIILKRLKHGYYYQGKCENIPNKYLNYYVLDHSSLERFKKVEFTLVEGLDR